VCVNGGHRFLLRHVRPPPTHRHASAQVVYAKVGCIQVLGGNNAYIMGANIQALLSPLVDVVRNCSHLGLVASEADAILNDALDEDALHAAQLQYAIIPAPSQHVMMTTDCVLFSPHVRGDFRQCRLHVSV